MYIEPQTNIRLLHNVPLDTTYDHTIYFASASAQQSYFMSLQKYNLTNYTYQRVKRGTARVGIKADNLYDCNYMMFQNSGYGTKWFYAFIISVEFVNNEVTEITFEIDVMQTWFFDCSPDYCYVEREHSTTDAIGDNIVPEQVDTGEYVYNGYGKLTASLDPLAVVMLINDSAEDADGTVYDGVYGGCTMFAYDYDDVESINAKIQQYNQKPDAIVAMYMCPAIATGGEIGEGGMHVLISTEAETLEIEQDAITTSLYLDGYKPKNNKLYTYPYNFLSVSSGKNNAVYRYEFFDNLTAKFKINVPLTMPVQVALRPKQYKGSGTLSLNGETLVLDDYPMCSWSTDSFRAWVAQNSLPIAGTVGAAGISAVLGAAGIAFPPLAVAGGVTAVANLMSQGYQASIAADTTRGSINSGSIDVASKIKTFWGGRMSVNAQYAKMIDEYFSMYGYATKRVKIPNRSARPHWNYVKTVNATVTGSVPADDMRKICEIYNSGVTFWKNGSEVGNYSLDNSL